MAAHTHTHTSIRIHSLWKAWGIKKDEDEVKVAARQNEKKAHTGNNFEEQRAKQQKEKKNEQEIKEKERKLRKGKEMKPNESKPNEN